MYHVKYGFSAIAVAAAALLTAGSASVSGWTVVPVPPAGQNVLLTSVSADSGSDAWAVGAPGRIADHWNGSSWQQVTVPAATTYVRSFSFTAVSAASPVDAWAVGAGYGKSIAYHWNGSAWTQDGANLSWLGVADVGPGNAWTAGPGISHWDGTSWTVTEFPDPGNPGMLTIGRGSDDVQLAAISADAANDIWAVGTFATNITCSCDTETFALHWNGTSWDQVPMPAVDRGADPNLSYQLTSIHAFSPSDVWAAGYTYDLGSTSSLNTIVEHWDGTSWTIVPAPSPGTSPELTGISGTSPTSVWAVGYDTAAGASGPQTLTLFWNGTAWATVSSPNPNGPSQLEAVSGTPGSSTVWAAGLTGGAGSPAPLALKNG